MRIPTLKWTGVVHRVEEHSCKVFITQNAKFCTWFMLDQVKRIGKVAKSKREVIRGSN